VQVFLLIELRCLRSDAFLSTLSEMMKKTFYQNADRCTNSELRLFDGIMYYK